MEITKITDLQTQAAKLTEQQSWIIKGIASLMDQWQTVTDTDADYYSTTILATRTIDFGGHAAAQTLEYKLITGSKELKATFDDPFTGDHKRKDWDNNSVWWTEMSTKSLRLVLSRLPQAMAECLDEMKNAEAENDTALELLNTLHNAFNIA